MFLAIVIRELIPLLRKISPLPREMKFDEFNPLRDNTIKTNLIKLLLKHFLI
jgi:hypothetical protein